MNDSLELEVFEVSDTFSNPKPKNTTFLACLFCYPCCNELNHLNHLKVRGERPDEEDAAAPSRASAEDESLHQATRKKKRRRKLARKLKFVSRHQQQQETSTVLNLPGSSKEAAEAECSKRDSTSSLGGARHSTFRESLLTVLGKLVIWKGTRYRPTPSAVPPNSPPSTECIGRPSVFFSSGELSPPPPPPPVPFSNTKKLN